ncbi:hypothetical protein V8F20_006402 [Naviculisporaceae sp. PSN 640]
MLSSQTSRNACAALLVALLSSVPLVNAQACGLEGFKTCGEAQGSGCCPNEWECYATECSYTGTSTAAPPATTACPGVPAHHLCPESSGGGCCYQAHACDPDNAKQCILTSTQRVFEAISTHTTVVDGNPSTILSTISTFYPWPTVSPRVKPSGPVPSASVSETESSAPETTAAPETTPAPSTASVASSSTITAAAGHIGAGVGGVIGGIAAALLV